MPRAIRWAFGILAGAGALVALGYGSIYLASEWHMRSFATPPPFAHSVSTDSEAVARGEHLVRTRGCRGCHGSELQGQFMWEYAAAPSLSGFAHDYDVARFEAALRHGIAPDGRAMYSMPAFGFLRLRDTDVADMYAYLRSLPVQRAELPESTLSWSIRYELATGADKAIAGFLALVPELAYGEHPDPAIARGEYLAMTTC